MECDRERDNRRLVQRAGHKSEMNHGGSAFPVINSGGRAREFLPGLVQTGRGRKSHSVLNETFSLRTGNYLEILVELIPWVAHLDLSVSRKYFCRAKMRQLWL